MFGSVFRLPTSDFVLHNGQTMTWLLGTKLIRITTSGCTQKPTRSGLCDKCYSSCIFDKGINFSFLWFLENFKTLKIYICILEILFRIADSINFGSSSEEMAWENEKERQESDVSKSSCYFNLFTVNTHVLRQTLLNLIEQEGQLYKLFLLFN